MYWIAPMIEGPSYAIAERVEVRPDHTALIVVDMQNDFVDPQGSLCVGTARATVPAIGRLCAFGRAHGLTVVYTQDWHHPDDPEFALWGAHAVAGPLGGANVPEPAAPPQDLVIPQVGIDGVYVTSLHPEPPPPPSDSVPLRRTVSNIIFLPPRA